MTIQPDDPRLTAYALGEVSDEERAQVETELRDSPQAQAELAAIRHTAELLTRELSAESAPSLTDEQRDAVAAAAAFTGLEREDSDRSPEADALGYTTSPVPGEGVTSPGATAGLSSSARAPLEQAPKSSPTESRSDGIVKPGASAPGTVIPAIIECPAGATSTVAADRASRRRRLWLTTSVAASWVVVAIGAYQLGAITTGSPSTAASSRHASEAMASVERDELASVLAAEIRPAGGRQIVITASGDIPSHMSGEDGINDAELRPHIVEALPGFVDMPASDSNLATVVYPVADLVAPIASDGRGNWGYAGARGEVERTLAAVENTWGGSKAGANDGPIPDEPPIYYPPAEMWRRLTAARERYKAVDQLVDFDVDTDDDGLSELADETQLLGDDPRFNTEAYDPIVENTFHDVTQYPLSTFSIDVDTASYANVRRMLNAGALPPPGAVRIEEFVNYFDYDYAPPDGTEPFVVRAEVAECPWRPAHRLLRIGIKGRQLAAEKRPASNLVFLLDVSGSMNQPAKLPLVKQGMRLLVERLEENDRVAIVVYAGASGLVLDSTPGAQKQTILNAIDSLQPGGSTNGAAGIELAYQIAEHHFIADGVNRVILATDGDFNIGVTDQSQLVELIEDKATGGVFLSVLGFGMGNLKDSTLEKLADQGNGNYAYIDTEREARKVLVRQMDGTLVTIAKDVKIQLEFNPVKVAAYRLIGYENRVMAKEDFNDDTKDAGEIGAGHMVTALYEVVPAGQPVETPDVDELEYQIPTHPTDAARESPNLLSLKLRYKEPDGQESKLLRFPVEDSDQRFGQSDADFQFASAVAAFGMMLRNSAYRGEGNYDAVLEYAAGGLAPDEHGYRAEFVELVKTARELAKQQTENSSSE